MPETTVKIESAEDFYTAVLDLLIDSEVPFMVGGAYAMREYAGLDRDTKDLDIFCTAGDYPRLLQVLADAGFATEITDANWLAKACYGDHLVDLIFGTGNGIIQVDDGWLENARAVGLWGRKVKLIPPEEELWTKLYIQDRFRFDGADVNHIIRKEGANLDWKRVLRRMELHWEILFAHLLSFRFVYPAERDKVPNWLVEELSDRVKQQLTLPVPKERICRGGLLSRTQYEIDVTEWGYAGFESGPKT